jgi:hypothetical protein
MQIYMLTVHLKALGIFFNLNYQHRVLRVTETDGDHEHKG